VGRVARVALLALGVGLASCEASVATSPDASTPFTEEAIRSAALVLDTKVCTAIATCDPVLFERTYGTMDACASEARSLAELTSRYGYGSTLTPEAVRACARALDLSTCEAYARFQYEAELPAACRGLAYGSLSEGSACRLGNQCASGRCSIVVEPCGRCAPRTSVCAGQGACEPGSTCIAGATESRCVPFAELGASCHPLDRPCHPHLVCHGTCVTPAATCDPAYGCSAVPAFRYCNAQTKTCEPLPIAQGGGSCAARTGFPAVQCAAGFVCGHVPGGDASPSALVCVPRIEDGKACDARLYRESPCSGRRSTCAENVCKVIGPAECSPPPVPP
jgi:hypothetical protein